MSSWVTPDLQLFEFYLYEATHLISIGFVCFIIKPLWTLANGRPVLIIVFSKALLSLIDDIGTLLQRTSLRVQWDVLETTMFIWRLRNKELHDILQFAAMSHITALAFNRMHCIMWPFHYNGWISKKKIIVQCILLCILGILIGEGLRWQIKTAVSANQLVTWNLYIAIGLYLIVGARLVWKKYSSDELSQSAGEKDFNKITIVCLSGLVPLLITLSAQAVALANRNDLNITFPMQLLQTIFGTLFYCADELCLIVLLADFRRIIKKFLRSLFGRWTNYNGNNSQNVVNIIVIPISKNGMPPISSVAP